MNKLILALTTLAGISVKGDETEDQLEAAIKAHKPAPQKFEMNLEDPETKKHFDAAVTAGITAALPAAVSTATKPLEDQVTKLTALVTNGQAGSAQGGKAIEGAGEKEGEENQNKMTLAAFNQMSPYERNEFMKNGGKLI